MTEKIVNFSALATSNIRILLCLQLGEVEQQTKLVGSIRVKIIHYTQEKRTKMTHVTTILP